MRSPDTTPIRDARNAVGLLTDVVDLALAVPTFAEPSSTLATKLEPFTAGRDTCREFSKSSRRVFNGANRSTSSGLYNQLKDIDAKIVEGVAGWWDNKIRDLLGTLGSMVHRNIDIAVMVMEDVRKWDEVYVSKRTVSAVTLGGTSRTIDPAWLRQWHDHVSEALRLGADLHAIHVVECNWRFRDLTDRRHRGLNTRAAFEAAWLAGEYKFARRLVEQD